MTKLDRKPDESFFQDDGSADEIEIIEIVGMDDDAPAPSVKSRAKDADEDEIVLDLDGSADDDGAEAAGRAAAAGNGGEDTAPTEDQFVRLQADFENFKTRVERERKDSERQASAALVSRLLPVLDNFERAVSAAPPDGASQGFHDGVSLIFRQILDELRKEGLTAIDSVGEVFNPELHEAVATDTTSELPVHTVVEELQRGYLLHDRLLRPALVRVRVDPSHVEERIEE